MRKVKLSIPVSIVKLKFCYGFYEDAIKVLEDGDLQTLGLLDYDKRLTHSFTAHPKVDPFTGKKPILNKTNQTVLNQFLLSN